MARKSLKSRRSENIFGLFVLLLLVIVSYQNCGKMGVKGNDELPIENMMDVYSVDVQGAPEGVSNDSTHSISLEQRDPESRNYILRYLCSLDGGTAEVCTFPYQIQTTRDGNHTIEVYAILTNNRTVSLKKSTWITDSTGPVVTVNTPPPIVTSDSTFAIPFTISDATSPVTGPQCFLDGSLLLQCRSPLTLNSLSEGSHSLEIRATDTVGNQSSNIIQWTIDRTAATARFVNPPQFSSNQVQFTFEGSESGIREFRCRLDEEPERVCANPTPLTDLSEGQHSVSLRVVDQAGNVSEVAEHNWTVDLTAPSITLHDGPGVSTPRTLGLPPPDSFLFRSPESIPPPGSHANLEFVVYDLNGQGEEVAGVASVQCSLDDAPFSACTSPVASSTISVGDHRFRIRATDFAANAETLTYEWSVRVSNHLATGSFHTCLVQGNDVRCWGNNPNGELNATVAGAEVQALVAGSSNTCALTNGTPICWGSNFSSESSPPNSLTNQTGLMSGLLYNCAINSVGQANCWGYQGYFQFPPHSLGGLRGLSGGPTFSCGILENRSAQCWGTMDDPRTIPPSDLESLSTIASGLLHTCAVTSSGLVRCWGDNEFGQSTPPSDLANITSVSAGNRHTCALTSAGTVRCWGDNEHGQTTVPSGLTGVTKVSAGALYNCALHNGGLLACWGRNFIQDVMPSGLQAPVPLNYSLTLRDGPQVLLEDTNISAQSLGEVQLVSNREYRLQLDVSGFPNHTEFRMSITNVSRVGSAPIAQVLSPGNNTFMLPSQGTHEMTLTVLSRDEVIATKRLVIEVMCSTPTFTVDSLTHTAVTVSRGSGSHNLFTYNATGVTTRANGQAPYQYAWDPTGVGIRNTPFSSQTTLTDFYSDLIGNRSVGLYVKDACNVVHRITVFRNLPSVPPNYPGSPFIDGTTVSGSETPDARFDNVDYLATNQPGNQIVSGQYGAGHFVCESNLQYDMPLAVSHGVRVEIRELVETIPINPAVLSGQIATPANGSPIRRVILSSDGTMGMPRVNLVQDNCVWTNPGVRVLQTAGVPCADGSGTNNQTSIEVWGNFRCDAMMGNPNGLTQFSGRFDCISTIVDGCIGGQGQGQGGITPF